MKKSLLLSAIVAMGLMTGCGTSNSKEMNSDTMQDDSSVVYFTSEISPEALVKIYKALGKEATGRVAVKISTGEGGNNHYLKPELIKLLVDEVKGTIVECNTAYAGSRNTTEAHWKTIKEHGFLDIAKVDIMDEEGDMQIPVRDTTHMKYNTVGSHMVNYDFMINLAHFKGHQMGGFGGVLKNQSIGVASSKGKAYIHSAGVTDSPDEVWSKLAAQDDFLESMAAAAQSVHDYFKGNIIYINVMNNMSIDCDCNGSPAAPCLKDMGIMASLDPVALDQACLDMVFGHNDNKEGDDNQPLVNRIKEMHGTHTVDHAAKIGLGKKEYKLVRLDK